MHKSLQNFRWIIAGSLFILASCKKNDGSTTFIKPIDTTNNAAVNALLSMNAPENFNFETFKTVSMDITILAPDNTPVQNIPISIMSKAAELGGVVLYKSLTDNNGKISGSIKLSSYVTQVVIDPQYVGVIRNAAVDIVNGTLSCTLGGSNNYSGNVVLNSPLSGRVAQNVTGSNLRPLSFYSYMGTFDSQGKPNYLQATDAVISNSFLAKINASLPEGKPVYTFHPNYLSNTSETNLNIITQSDIYFTFVTEGAGYKSPIAYFTYPTGFPPTSNTQIDSLHIILPNASLAGSGGSLHAGNTINLGRFSPGTSIGFALIANGWTGTGVNNGYWINYTVDQINPSAAANLKRQSILLYDITQDLFLVGIEDIRRDNSNCDNDFNDCVFYIKSKEVKAISIANVNPIDTPNDTDKDGVNDVYDAFPLDPTRAYINYYPGTVAFEDNWPFLGDYDFNDLVVNYTYSVISDALNRAVEIKADYVLQASGASYKNGFGVELPIASSLVKSVTGNAVNGGQLVTLAANGCEAGQTKAVIIPFDNAYTAMKTNQGFNTYLGAAFLTRDTIKMDIIFDRPLLASELGMAPFNPFIIIDQTRGREAHFAGYTPTNKVDTRFFKTGVDNTVPALNKYYKTTTNLPWGIGFVNKFNYPVELSAVNTVYTNFIPWAQSGGVNAANWFSDSTKTVKTKVYKK